MPYLALNTVRVITIRSSSAMKYQVYAKDLLHSAGFSEIS